MSNPSDPDQQQNWRQFQGTELGGLLSSIYGAQRKVIKYPVLRGTKAFEPDKNKFRPVNSTLASTDATKATRKPVQVAVPKNFGLSANGSRHSESKENLGPYLPHRKPEETIRAEIDELYIRQRSYRPAHVQPQGEAEKDRYSQICTYKGGKALPKGLITPSGEAPFEAQQRIAQQRQNDEYIAKRRAARGEPSTARGTAPPAPSPRMTMDEKFAAQISSEIDERVEHLEQLRAIGGVSRKAEAQLLGEINARVTELGRFNM